MLGGAAVHRFSHRRCAAGRDLLVSGVGAHGQRGGAGAAVWHVRLGDRRHLPRPGAHCGHRRRAGDRPHEPGEPGRALGVRHSRSQQPRGPAGLGRPLRPGLEACARDRAQGRALHHRRRGRGRVDPRLCAAGFHGASDGQGQLVVGAAGGADRRADVFQRGGHHPRGAGAAGQGRGAGHDAGFHDGGHRTVFPRIHDSQEGDETQADRAVRRCGGGGHHRRGLCVQRGDVTRPFTSISHYSLGDSYDSQSHGQHHGRVHGAAQPGAGADHRPDRSVSPHLAVADGIRRTQSVPDGLYRLLPGRQGVQGDGPEGSHQRLRHLQFGQRLLLILCLFFAEFTP